MKFIIVIPSTRGGKNLLVCLGKNSSATNRKNNIKQKSRVRAFLDNIKSDGCILCGYRKCFSALEFHHIAGDKEFQISHAKKSLKKVKLEIGKCICVCANCHREIHANQGDGFGHIATIKIIDVGNKQLGLWGYL